MTNMTNDEAINKLYGNLWQDPQLRVKALGDGNAAMEEILGVPVRGVKVVFHENSDSVVHLPLPPKPEELNSRSLNTLSQGKPSSGERGIFDIIKTIVPIAGKIIAGVGDIINK